MNNIQLIKKSCTVLLLFALISAHGFISQASTQQEIEVAKNEIYGAYRTPLGDYGFFNYDGRLIKKAEFDLMWQWDDEVIILREAGNFGAIDYYGLPRVSFKYEFLDRPSDGTIIYGTDVSYKGPRYYGLIDTRGKLIVEAQFDALEKMPGGGVITTIHYDTGTKYGMVFKNKTNVKPMFDKVLSYNEDYVIVANEVDHQWRYGFVSSNGSRSNLIYDQVFLTEDGAYAIGEWMEGQSQYAMLYNPYGGPISKGAFSYVSPKGFKDNEGNDKHFIAVVPYRDGHQISGFDLMDRSGKLFGYDLESIDYTPILGHYYRIKDMSGRVGLINAFGGTILQPRFTAIETATDTYFVGVVGGARGVFNLKGEDILALSNYDSIDISSDNYFIARKGKQFNVFNEKGYLQFQFTGESVEGIGHDRFITKAQSPFTDIKGKVKYYYNLVNQKGQPRVKQDQYAYMAVIEEDRIVLGMDTDGRSVFPSGRVEYIRQEFADTYGVVDFNGKEILPVAFVNMSPYNKGYQFVQKENQVFIDAYNTEGEKINPHPIASFDAFNWGAVTIAPFENVRRYGYLTKSGQFFQFLDALKVDDMVINHRLEMDGELIDIIEIKTEVYGKEVVVNTVNEKIIKEYRLLKNRFGNDIFILKDKQWYLDTFSQAGTEK